MNPKFSAYVNESCTNFCDLQCHKFVRRVVELTPELTDEQRKTYLELDDKYLLGEIEVIELSKLYDFDVIEKYFAIFAKVSNEVDVLDFE